MRKPRKPARTRKIVQIAGVEATIMALCDDGSIWLLAFENGERREWKPMPDIDQATTAGKKS